MTTFIQHIYDNTKYKSSPRMSDLCLKSTAIQLVNFKEISIIDIEVNYIT